MPQLIPVLLVGGVGVALGVTTIAQVGLSLALTGASMLLNKTKVAQAPEVGGTVTAEPEIQAASPVNASRSMPVQQAAPPRRFVYGKCRVGGALFFMDNANPYLLIGTILTDGQLVGDTAFPGVLGVFVGDKPVTFSPSAIVGAGNNAASGTLYSGKLSIQAAVGDPDQVASTLLTGSFPQLGSSFRQRGVARVVARLDWGADAQAHSATWSDSLEFSYIIEGIRVHSEGASLTSDYSDPTTWVQSPGIPSDYIAHALTNMWDSPLSVDDIDWPSVYQCYIDCHTPVVHNGVSVSTYQAAGIFQADENIATQIANMLSAMGGVITFNDGKYSLHADKDRASVITLTDEDIYEMGEFQNDIADADMFGSISASYFNADSGGAPDTTPVYEIDEGRRTSINLPFTATSTSAQILAYRALHKSRERRTLDLTVSDIGLWLIPFVDPITIDSVAAPFINGKYEVVQVDLVQEGAQLKLRGYCADAYADPAEYLV